MQCNTASLLKMSHLLREITESRPVLIDAGPLLATENRYQNLVVREVVEAEIAEGFRPTLPFPNPKLI